MLNHLGNLRGIGVWRWGGEPAKERRDCATAVRAQLVVVSEQSPTRSLSLEALGSLNPELPSAIVGAAAEKRSMAQLPNVVFATTYLAVECAGDDELAAVWLDAAAQLLGDPGELIPPPPQLRLTRVEPDLAVMSAPLGQGMKALELTAAERDILEGLVEGLSNAAIAERRQRSVATVARQVSALYRKLGAGSRAEVIRIVSGMDSD